jgi:hypothetical protein
MVGRRFNRVLTHKGIWFNGLFYNSKALSDLRNRYGSSLVVDIRVDDGNINSIHVLYAGTVIRVSLVRSMAASAGTQSRFNGGPVPQLSLRAAAAGLLRSTFPLQCLTRMQNRFKSGPLKVLRDKRKST